jgi:hypothetical protein
MLAKRFFFVSAALLCLALVYHVGARRAGAAATTTLQEVAVLSGQVANGATIPLPHYQDGTEALESECSWTVGLSHWVLDGGNTGASIGRMECSTQGRVVRVYVCVQADCGNSSDPHSGTANYMIVAIRNDLPTPVQQSTFGSVKVRYR